MTAIQVFITIKPEDWQNLLISCFEGGYSPWLHSAIAEGESDLPDKTLVWYGQPEFFAREGWSFRVEYDAESGNEGEGMGRKTITESDIQAGLQAMAKESPFQFSNLLNDNADALTGDSFMQCVIFGKLIYG